MIALRLPLLRRALAAAATAVWIAASPAWAGCGCDHPPPAWAQVMPPFGSPGKRTSTFVPRRCFGGWQDSCEMPLFDVVGTFAVLS